MAQIFLTRIVMNSSGHGAWYRKEAIDYYSVTGR